MKSKSLFYRTRILPFILFTVLLSSLLIAGKKDKSFLIKPETENTIVIFISDTQSPLLVETIVLTEKDNEKHRKKMLQMIIDQNPAAVFHTGDLVTFGFDNANWSVIDAFVGNLQKKGIRFFPTLGNHELMTFAEAGEENFIKRFPFYTKTGYTIIVDSLAVILLNSNFQHLTGTEIRSQRTWFENELLLLDQNPEIAAVIVGCHHSPFTNSTIVHPSAGAQEQFVPPFIGSKKTRFFISGHAHAFEHFINNGKHFAVIGGGGGLQQPLYTESEAKWEDQFAKTNLRRFHYIEYHLRKKELQVMMIDSLYQNFSAVYSISAGNNSYK